MESTDPQPPSTTSTLMKLSRELRDMIYGYLLVTPQPIIVWSAQLDYKFVGPGWTDKHYLAWDKSTMSLSRQKIFPDILRCNFRISLEASEILYGRNIFVFQGDHDWVPVIAWLYTIGIRNQSLLRMLELSVSQPATAWQLPDGSRMPIGRRRPRECWPRSAQFSSTPSPVPEGLVENINPALETIISMLSRTDGRAVVPRLILSMNVRFNLLPGVVLITSSKNEGWTASMAEEIDRNRSFDRYLSMDMPNLVERWRIEYTSCMVYRPIEIRWLVKTERVHIEQKVALLQKRGWDILETTDYEEKILPGVHRPSETPEAPKHIPSTRFVLRRGKLPPTLVAADPIPYIDMDRPDI